MQDDYFKFLRFAQWKIEQAGRGVVGMITNHGYLDNPTFRGMRQSLLRTFDAIYVLDLHGNALKRERTPAGGPDENVFDIRPGVAVVFLVKRSGERKQDARVHHAELWGAREAKYAWLEAHDGSDTAWRELQPQAPFHLFTPQETSFTATYNAFVSVPDLFAVNSVGIVTARDSLTIHWSPDEVWRTVTVFSGMEPELARQGFDLGPDAQDWKVALAQKDLLDSGPDRAKIAPLLYRPFDIRHTYYTGGSRGFICRPRSEVMRHMLAGENVGLMTCRQLAGLPWCHALVSDRMTDDCTVSNRTRERGYLFPLYLYPETDRRDLFSHLQPVGRRPNLNPQVVAALTGAHGQAPTPEQVFNYVYAVLYAPAYRAKYAQFLRLDFPRIPFTADRALFAALAGLGGRLVALHLLKSAELEQPTARFEGAGDSRVAKSKGLRYDPAAARVYINAGQYFAPVPAAVWGYQVGGYHVCHKWLKDRQERQLSLDEIRTYCRIVSALGRTLALQAEIDALYGAVEDSVLGLSRL